METTDEQLMAAYAAGDAEALGTLYLRMKEPLYCFLYRYTGEEQLSIDIVHDTFEIIQRRKSTFEADRGTFKAFLFQIGYRLLMNKLKRRTRWRKIVPFLTPLPQAAPDRDDMLAVRDAILRLPDKQRAVVLLAYYEDLPMHDIALILEIPAGTVKSRLHHAMNALKKELEETAYEKGI